MSTKSAKDNGYSKYITDLLDALEDRGFPHAYPTGHDGLQAVGIPVAYGDGAREFTFYVYLMNGCLWKAAQEEDCEILDEVVFNLAPDVSAKKLADEVVLMIEARCV